MIFFNLFSVWKKGWREENCRSTWGISNDEWEGYVGCVCACEIRFGVVLEI